MRVVTVPGGEAELLALVSGCGTGRDDARVRRRPFMSGEERNSARTGPAAASSPAVPGFRRGCPLEGAGAANRAAVRADLSAAARAACGHRRVRSGGGWRGDGAVSMVAWVTGQCGVSTSTARQWVRSAANLESLPCLAEGLASGELSLDLVEPLAEVASAETDAALREASAHWSVRQARSWSRGTGRRGKRPTRRGRPNGGGERCGRRCAGTVAADQQGGG